jgi:glycosyltransferase involved in cell wall biosynthesis
MRILHISPNFPWPSNDGGKIVTSNFLNLIKDYDIELDFICINKSDVNSELLQQNNLEADSVFIDFSISSKWSLAKSLVLNKPILIHKFFNRNFLEFIKSKLSNKTYDLIHFESLHTVYYAFELLELFNGPMVLRLHNIESQILERLAYETLNPVLKRVFLWESTKINRLEIEAYQRIRNITFISQDDLIKSGIKDIPQTNPFVATAGVEFNLFKGILPPTSNNILYIGSMDWLPNEKAVLWFVENVFLEIQKEFPETKLYIVGKNPSKKILTLKGDNIIVTGLVDNVVDYINLCSISIVPIFIGGGMRVKILELMAAGRAIVSTTIGAEGIIYRNNEDILIADTKEEFFQKIKYLLESPNKRIDMGKNARINVQKNYSWKRKVNEYASYLKKLI